MKGMVVYDSSHGNTKKIAETIAETLKESGIEVDIFYVKDVKIQNLKDYNILVIGCPTRFGTMSFTMKGFLGKVKGEDWQNTPFATFDTELRENIDKKEGSSAEKIANKLREKQMNQLLPVMRAVVLGQKGPLQEGEIERAREYARRLATELK